MSAGSDVAAGGASGKGAGQDRLHTAVKYGVAAFWVMRGLGETFVDRVPTIGIPLLAMAVAFVRWPSVLRWPMTACTLVPPTVYLYMFLWYGHALTDYAKLVWFGLCIVGHLLLLFGRECHCGWVDIDALEYLMLRTLDPPAPEYLSRPIPRDFARDFVGAADSDLTVQQWVGRLR